MTDYATLLRDHITLTCRSIDRIFLQAYAPKLQSVGQVCLFLNRQRGFRIPSSALASRAVRPSYSGQRRASPPVLEPTTVDRMPRCWRRPESRRPELWERRSSELNLR